MNIMKRANGLYVGQLATTVHDLAQSADLLGRYEFWLITSIDSEMDLHRISLATTLVERSPDCTFLGNGLLVRSPRANEINQLFSGFDELWCFKQEPVTPKPEAVTIVPPINPTRADIIAALEPWMRDTLCEIGLGDGVGLTYVTVNPDLPQVLSAFVSELE